MWIKFSVYFSHQLVEQALSTLNTCLGEEGGNPELTMAALKSDFLHLDDLDESCAERYHVALSQARQEKGEELTAEEIKQVLAEVNEQVRLERKCKCGWEFQIPLICVQQHACMLLITLFCTCMIISLLMNNSLPNK